VAHELYIGSAAHPASTVFDLLGREDDLTRALAWGLSRSEALLAAVLGALDLPFEADPVHRLTVQLTKTAHGRTDIEVEAGDARVIFEAKLGWNLPTEGQMALYEKRLTEQITESAAGRWSSRFDTERSSPSRRARASGRP
jgi:hypothetical protein